MSRPPLGIHRVVRVLLTGGTGFVGSHCVPALLGAGHDVRLLVRSKHKADNVLAPHHVDVSQVELVEGDVTARDAVEGALRGCDSVISAASFFSLQPRDEAEVRRVNLGAAETVLGTAHRLGLDPIVHVSSISVLVGPVPKTPIDEDSPIGAPVGAYAESKAEAERCARGLQDEGAPVVITYPTMVVGPKDPTMGAGMASLAHTVKGLIVAQPRGGMDLVDVRDVAEGHVAALQIGRGPRRFLLAGHHLTGHELVEVVNRLTGRRLRSAVLPTRLAYAFCRVGDVVQRHVSLDLPLTTDALTLLVRDCMVDASRTQRELGVHPRPLDETLRETLAWMADAGVISHRQAGQLVAA